MLDIIPFHFGDEEHPLFGCHHRPPAASTSRSSAVVICAPIGQEHLRSHRALRLLATRLSQTGFHVLRFDYFGCGDSAGDDDQGRINDWVCNVRTAVDVIRRRTRVDKVCLVGLRLGGALAVLAAAQQREVGSLVLWDPVLRGADFVRELTRAQHEKLQELTNRELLATRQQGFLGFDLSETLLAEVDELDLSGPDCIPACPVLMLDSVRRRKTETRDSPSQSGCAEVTLCRIDEEANWLTGPIRTVMPHNAINTVVSWITTSCP